MFRSSFRPSNRLAAFTCLSVFALGAACSSASAYTQSEAGASEANVQAIKARHAARWDFYGIGEVSSYHGQVVLSEGEDSLGAMIVSPDSYCGDIKIRFDAMALQPAAVLVASFAIENRSESGLTFPSNYDGNVDYMFDNLNMYNFILHASAHNRPGPFLRRFPGPEKKQVAAASEPYMETGKYHSIEVSRQGNDIALSIDGARVVAWQDETPLERGHFVLRVRGTAQERGAVLIRNLEVENTPDAETCSSR